MDLRRAILAAAADAPAAAIDGLIGQTEELTRLGALDNPRRVAHMIGQCAHESLRFTVDSEGLYYSTASRIRAVWPRRFSTVADAEPFARNPEKLANKVYGGRMGNTDPGDGYRFRGRGYIQLTGRDNYRRFGPKIGIDLEANPDLAREPGTAWLIAAGFMANVTRQRRTIFQWADDNSVEDVTRAINGGTHGLADRKKRTFLALAALGEGMPEKGLVRGAVGSGVFLLQSALATAGFSPGSIDGQFGKGTLAALKAFQVAEGLLDNGIFDDATADALNSVTGNAHRLIQASPPLPFHAPATSPMPVNKARPSDLAPATSPVPTARPEVPALSPGSVGEEVLGLQILLIRKGYSISSRYGPSTTQAVRAFQADHGLPETGVVDAATRDALGPFPT